MWQGKLFSRIYPRGFAKRPPGAKDGEVTAGIARPEVDFGQLGSLMGVG